jgi:hypothetical protein
LIFGSQWAETKEADDIDEYNRFEERFELYSQIARNASKNNALRAYAFAQMGNLCVPCPGLQGDAEGSGYIYHLQAIQLSVDCGDAWSGIVSGYGDHMPYHQDQGRFLEGLGRLLQERDQLPDAHKAILEQGMAQLGVPIKTFKPEDEYWKG